MTDHQLISLILKGEPSLYKHIVDRYAKMSFAVAYRIVKNSDDCQDIVQESFIAAYDNLKNFKGESKFSTWLYRIVVNKALAVKNNQKYFDEISDIGQNLEDYNEEIDTNNEQLVAQALQILQDKERLIIDLFYFQDQSIKEISQITQATEVNVKVMLHRARKKMNEYVQKSIKFAHNE
ncbi:MAG: sigma-70 family RNA polymerase sigma factor [Chitinophagales bacterium]|nr:sigma-70 family RNA polymerase sigma factor [Chitinophagales bacterium]